MAANPLSYLDEVYAAIQLLGGAVGLLGGDEEAATPDSGTIDNPPMPIDTTGTGGGTPAPADRGWLDRLTDWLPGGNPPGGPVAAPTTGYTLTDACDLFRPAPITVPPDVAASLPRVIDWLRNDPAGRRVGAMFVRSFLGRPCDNVPPGSRLAAFGEQVRHDKKEWYKVLQMWRGGAAAPIGMNTESAQLLWMFLEVATADGLTMDDAQCSCRTH